MTYFDSDLGDYDLEDYELGGSSGPTPVWFFIVGVGVLLLIAFFFVPWLTFAPGRVQQQNYERLVEWTDTLMEMGNVYETLSSLGINVDQFDPIEMIDNDGWSELRREVASRRGVEGIWLLTSPYCALPLTIRVGAQAVLIALIVIWCVVALSPARGTAQRPFSLILLGLAVIVTLAHIFGLPKLDTLGRDDSFSLAFLMAVALASPGWGLWLTLIGNIALVAGLAASLAGVGGLSRSDTLDHDLWG